MVNEVFPGYNTWEPKDGVPNKAPTLSCTFTNEFGDTHTVSASLMNSTLFEVYANMRLACLGFGFHEDNIKEIFGESV